MHANQLSHVTLALAVLAGSAAAQSGGPYDLNGDPLEFGGDLLNPPVQSAATPGTVWNSWALMGASSINGIAPYKGDILVKANGIDGIVRVRESDGMILGNFPTSTPADLWLGYDESRDLIITADPFNDVLRGYTPGNAVPVFEVPTPTNGPTGLAWDSLRDEYVYADFETDQIVVIDAATLTLARTLDTPSLTRMAGTAYDCTDDAYIVGDRDQREHFLVDPITGAIGLSFPSAGQGTSVPRGLAQSSDGGIWSGDFQFPDVILHEAGHGPVIGCGVGDSFCGPAAANSTGSSASIAAVGSTAVVDNDLVLQGFGLPLQSFGYFLGSQTQDFVANAGGSAGNLCLGGAIGRAVGGSTVNSGNGGFVTVTADLTAIPQPTGPVMVMVGETWNFQCWFRDSIGGTASSNFTDGVSVTFQ
ncbi:MAG: hypothetical protein AAF726_06835 [Planctomycetota bacterium]